MQIDRKRSLGGWTEAHRGFVITATLLLLSAPIQLAWVGATRKARTESRNASKAERRNKPAMMHPTMMSGHREART